MRQQPGGRRPRGRSNRKQFVSPKAQIHDSHGPDVRVRGNPVQVYEKYLNVLRAAGRTPTVDEVTPFVIMLAPMAPHLSEELWTMLGGPSSIFDHATWPRWDEDLLRTESIEVPVQVNGKLRGTVTVERGAPADVVREAALADENVRRHIAGAEVRKTIHVPDRLLNLVVG